MRGDRAIQIRKITELRVTLGLTCLLKHNVRVLMIYDCISFFYYFT